MDTLLHKPFLTSQPIQLTINTSAHVIVSNFPHKPMEIPQYVHLSSGHGILSVSLKKFMPVESLQLKFLYFATD